MSKFRRVGRTQLIPCLILLLLSGCAGFPKSAIDGYWDGPTADLADSMFNETERRADFCVLDSIDGRRIINSLDDTQARTVNRGLTLYPFVTTRAIKVHPMRINLRCTTYYAAPVLAIGHKALEISGSVDFQPVENARYVVSGAPVEGGFSVWIADQADGRAVTEKIVVVVDRD